VFALEERKAIAEMIINGSVLEALQDGLRDDAHEPGKRMTRGPRGWRPPTRCPRRGRKGARSRVSRRRRCATLRRSDKVQLSPTGLYAGMREG
jgi:hypothetical protein